LLLLAVAFEAVLFQNGANILLKINFGIGRHQWQRTGQGKQGNGSHRAYWNWRTVPLATSVFCGEVGW
jgi:hypothetical protein